MTAVSWLLVARQGFKYTTTFDNVPIEITADSDKIRKVYCQGWQSLTFVRVVLYFNSVEARQSGFSGTLVEEAGWPLRCLYRKQTFNYPRGEVDLGPRQQQEIFSPRHWVEGIDITKFISTTLSARLRFPIVLPINIRPLRLIGNIAIFVVAWTILDLIIAQCVRSRRAHLRRCIRCGYQIDDLSQCPECSLPAIMPGMAEGSHRDNVPQSKSS